MPVTSAQAEALRRDNPFLYEVLSEIMQAIQDPKGLSGNGQTLPAATVLNLKEVIATVTGSGVIQTLPVSTPPVPITLIKAAGASWTLGTTGNIAAASSSPPNRPTILIYDQKAKKYYPLAAAAADACVYNVLNYGAKGDGVGDDTAAINATIAAAGAASPRGTVWFPCGTYNTTGLHDLVNLHGIQVVGAGIGSTIIQMTHATNDVFRCSGNLNEAMLSGFSITASVVRTAGWAFNNNVTFLDGTSMNRCRFDKIQVRKQKNGFAIRHYSFGSISGCFLFDFVGDTGRGIQVGDTATSANNMGSGLRIIETSIYGNDVTPGAANHLGIGLWVEDVDAVYAQGLEIGGALQGDVVIKGNAAGSGSSNHFFSRCVFDSTKTGPCVQLTGAAGQITEVMFTGCWFVSAGRLAGGAAGLQGFLVDVDVGVVGLSGCTIWNTSGNALQFGTPATAISGSLRVTGCSISSSQANYDGVYVNASLNNPAPNLTGNMISGGGGTGVGIHSLVNSTKLALIGNRRDSVNLVVAPIVDIGSYA